MLSNDSDADGDTLSVTQFVVNGVTYSAGTTATIAGVGSLVINSNGSYTFTPVAAYDGPVPSATYTITDGTATASAVLSFAPVPNAPPVAVNDGPVTTIANTNATGNVLSNDSDADGDTLSVTQFTVDINGDGIQDTIIVSAAGTGSTLLTVLGQPIGTLSISSTGVYTFKPAPTYNGPVPVATYTISDGSSTDTATLSFAPVPNTPPVATPVTTGGASTDTIPLPLGGTDIDGIIASVTIKALPPASQGVLTLANGTPVTAGQVLTTSQASSLVFKPNSGYNGIATILFSVTDNQGLESPIASANINLATDSGLFEQLQTNPIKFGNNFNPDDFAFRSPVVPIGMPENLYVTHSVRESQNQIAQNSALGLFNVANPTAKELDNFTFDLKGLPVGMDSNLFVQNAVRGIPVTFEPRLFVQNAVRQSQLESTARNIGVSSFNSATPGVIDLFSPFEIGSPLSFDLAEIAPPVADLSPIKNTNRDIVFKDSTVDKQKINKECIPLKTQTRDYTQTHAHKPYVLKTKPATERLQPASSFTKQLTHAKHKSSTNVFCKH